MTQPKLRGVLLLTANKLKILIMLPWLYKKKHTNRAYFYGWGSQITVQKDNFTTLFTDLCETESYFMEKHKGVQTNNRHNSTKLMGNGKG